MTADFILGNRDMCKALGLNPDTVTSITIMFTVDAVAKVVVESYVPAEALKTVQRFDLVPSTSERTT